MRRIEVQTYKAEITVGLKEGYTGPIHQVEEAQAICQNFCDEEGLGLEFNQALCIYTQGNEPCIHLNLINYPRFPKTPEEVFETAERLGLRLANAFKQKRFTIVATDKTVMFELDTWIMQSQS